MAVRLSIKAGEHRREDCPVSVRVDLQGMDPNRLVVQCDGSRSPLPAQAVPEGDAFRVSWVVPEIAARTERTCVLAEAPGPASQGVAMLPGASKVDVTLDGALFTSFHHADSWARPFLHPIIGPYGAPITRAYPVIADIPGEKQDHPHHKSFWVAWGDLNGSDNWSEAARGHGVQRAGALSCLPGPVFGRIGCSVDWLSEQRECVLHETREMVFWNLPAAGRMVDLSVTFQALAAPVRFGDTKEGGICSIRVASSMDASGQGSIVNAYGGINEAETWGKRAHWCDYVGPVEGRTVGIAIFDHPSNFRYPTYWHVRNYGLMTANPFGLSHFHGDKSVDGSHTLAAGGTLRFRYRVYFHAGNTEAAAVAGKYHDYIAPPAVSVVG